MLMYFGTGRRDYHRDIIKETVRPNWEFQVVVKGKCAPRLGQDVSRPWYGRSLWVFPPGAPHGWASPQGQPCRIAVFHFEPNDINDLLRQACQHAGYLRIDLSPLEIKHILTLSRKLQKHYPATTRLTTLLVDRIRSDLSWYAANRLDQIDVVQPLNDNGVRARQALAWFNENLGRRVGVDDVARGMGLTPGHLRKIFKSAGFPPPSKMLTKVRLDRARNLLQHTDLTIAEIAAAIGMSGPTAFCRQFRNIHGISPRTWAINRTSERSTVNQNI